MLLASGALSRWGFGLLGAGTLGGIAGRQVHILDDCQINRFWPCANPEVDPAGVGSTPHQARIAIGSGGPSPSPARSTRRRRRRTAAAVR
ncbi:hypothetical protein ADL00_26090 [Streptomyces sp. AS58]|nr:hypothetical protein ADL00_26090 [Streptomyces sp. AS58]